MAQSLLGRILSGSERTPSLLVQDSSQRSGRLLLRAVSLQCLQRYSASHLFLFDLHPEAWLAGVSRDLAQRLTVHDCFSDHLGWRTGTGPAPLHEATPTSFIKEIEETTPPQLSDCAVIIDSLSTLLDFHPSSRVCQLVHQLSRRCGLVVCLLHSDLHDSHVTLQVGHVISTTVDLTTLPTADQLQVKVQHRKHSGKLLVATERVAIGNSYEVSSAPPLTSSLTSSSSAAPDPTLNLTFDLTLSKREREERGRLVLPYHHSAREKMALLQAGSGKVIYQPDEADDFDESDPDDDLDI